MIYIPKEFEKKVLRLVDNYRILKSAIYKASELNIRRFAVGRQKRSHE